MSILLSALFAATVFLGILSVWSAFDGRWWEGLGALLLFLTAANFLWGALL